MLVSLQNSLLSINSPVFQSTIPSHSIPTNAPSIGSSKPYFETSISIFSFDFSSKYLIISSVSISSAGSNFSIDELKKENYYLDMGCYDLEQENKELKQELEELKKNILKSN